MNKLLAATFAAALVTQGCHETKEPSNHDVGPANLAIVTNTTDVSILQTNLSLARVKCIGGRTDNARLAFEEALRIRRGPNIENNLSAREKAQLDADIETTRVAIAECLGTIPIHP